MISGLIKTFLLQYSEEDLKNGLDRLINILENVIKNSDNKIDDHFLILLTLLRSTFDIKSNN